MSTPSNEYQQRHERPETLRTWGLEFSQLAIYLNSNHLLKWLCMEVLIQTLIEFLRIVKLMFVEKMELGRKDADFEIFQYLLIVRFCQIRLTLLPN